ncbi:MAG: hypothetical protein PF436_03770 [Prolixibacteraceae bacterium]|jgi:hypothetical protein|nr:hypothetical protein [Prolixibacteraceae bacterium]
MKRILLILAIGLLTSCTSQKFVETYSYDLRSYNNDGFFVTTGDVDGYEPVAIISAFSHDGNLDNGDYVMASLDSAMNAACKSSVELGANALINVDVYISKKLVTVDGLAVKK